MVEEGDYIHQVGLIHRHRDICIVKSYGAFLKSGETAVYRCKVTGNTYIVKDNGFDCEF